MDDHKTQEIISVLHMYCPTLSQKEQLQWTKLGFFSQKHTIASAEIHISFRTIYVVSWGLINTEYHAPVATLYVENVLYFIKTIENVSWQVLRSRQ